MRKSRTLAAALVAASLWSAGCSKTTTVTAPDGTTVSMQQDGSKMTVKSDKGTMVVDQKSGTSSMTTNDGKTQVTFNSQQQVDLDKEFGLPGYPGAKQEATMSQSGKDAVKMATLTTADPFDKVAAFYKEKLGKVKGANVTEVNTGDQKMLNITLEESTRTVNATVMSADGGVRIQLNAEAKTPEAKATEPTEGDASKAAEGDKPADAAPSPQDAPAAPSTPGS